MTDLDHPEGSELSLLGTTCPSGTIDFCKSLWNEGNVDQIHSESFNVFDLCVCQK